MSNKQTGGPAFPLQPASTPEMHYTGMTLRDYFAGQALAGLLANPSRSGSLGSFAEATYQYVDAMMEARDDR